MTVLRFDPQGSLIRLRTILEFKHKKAAFLIFDPGALLTTITPQFAQALGYEPGMAARDFSVYTASGTTRASSFVLKSLSLHGETIESVETLCLSIPSEVRADGLLGLNFLRHFKIGLDFATGTLSFERIRPILS